LSSIIVIVDLLFIFRSDHRCIHDFFAGTIAVKLPEEEIYATQRVTSIMRKVFWGFLICALIVITIFSVTDDTDRDPLKLYEKDSLQEINDDIANGANVNRKNRERWTPLIVAAHYNHDPEVLTALINAGADINARSIYGYTPLMTVVSTNANPEATSAIINAGADVNVKDKDENTPIALAARYNSNPEVITDLIKAGTDVNTRDYNGTTPLIWAVLRNTKHEVISALIIAGADINAKSNNGTTALMWVAQRSNSKMIITLLDLGADAKLVNNSGKMAIDYARENYELKLTGALKRLENASY
jgi:ankyrin repeat protein